MIPLKDAIAAKHKQAERMVFNQKMFLGELTVEQYATYLQQLLSIFGVLEIHPLPNPHLYRCAALYKDIRELSTDKLPILSTTQDYINYLRPLTPDQQLPHVYLHYLALMYGGSMMKVKIPGAGRLYDFQNLSECMQSIRVIQQDDWADEANRGLDYFMDILDELQHVFRLTRL